MAGFSVFVCMQPDKLTMATAKSTVFDHFEMPESTEGTYKAKCKYCSLLISARGKTTSNLLTHIKVIMFSSCTNYNDSMYTIIMIIINNDI